MAEDVADRNGPQLDQGSDRGVSRRRAMGMAAGTMAVAAGTGLEGAGPRSIAGVAAPAAAAGSPADTPGRAPIPGPMSGSVDYHACCVALAEFTSALAAAAPSDPVVGQARKDALAGLSAEGAAALLGAFSQHLVAHGAGDGAELDLLNRASDLWARGVAKCAQLAGIRADLENALADPGNPASPARYNAAAVALQDFANAANSMRVEIDALRSDVLSFPHLPPHPRQLDKTSDQWGWGDLALGRRTDAFVRALFNRASSQRTLAFALGADAAYRINVAGKAYLGDVVGGPRRTHRYRGRLARNAVGSWLAAHHPAALPPQAMASAVTYGTAAGPVLPAELESLLQGALSDAYDLTKAPAPPDLQLGYRRLIQHLVLLDSFTRPTLPALPSSFWMPIIYGDPHNLPSSQKPQDMDVNGMDGGNTVAAYGPQGPGSTSPDGSDGHTSSGGCGIDIIILILSVLSIALVVCIGELTTTGKCVYWEHLGDPWKQDPPDPRNPPPTQDPQATSSELIAMAAQPETAQFIAALYDVHSQIWEALDKAYVFLAVSGLIYPASLLGSPLYQQFTSAVGRQAPWPHREEAVPADTYHLYPVSALENPTKLASPFTAGSAPAAFLATSGPLAGSAVSLGLWNQIVSGVNNSPNYDLDADRGYDDPCWATVGSVLTDPIGVRFLAYPEQ